MNNIILSIILVAMICMVTLAMAQPTPFAIGSNVSTQTVIFG